MVDNGGLDKGKPCSIASKLDVASPISRNGHMFFCLFGLSQSDMDTDEII